MPQQKPVVDDFEPLEDFDSNEELIDFDTNEISQKKDEPSLWSKLNTPLIDIPSRVASQAADIIDKPSLNRSVGRAQLEGFTAGATEGIGDLISDTTTPLSLLTGGVLSKIKPITKGIGKGVELTGRMLSEHKPLTAWMPRIAEPRMFRGMQELGGKGLEYIGKKMRGTDKIEEPLKSYKVIQSNPEESLSPIAKQYMGKRKMRANGDGTFTDLNTGEVLNSKGESIIEINGKPIDRNSSFFKRNRQ